MEPTLKVLLAVDHPWRFDINAVAAIVTAVATIGLAVTAVCQIRAAGRQATAAARQAARALTITRHQAEAAVSQAKAGARQADETREAALRQWQPRVHARFHGLPTHDSDMVGDDEVDVPVYIINEGTGPAFNVRVAIEVAGHDVDWREAQFWWSVQPREFLPSLEPDSRQPVPERQLHIGVRAPHWNPDGYSYVTRFDNLFGERFELRDFPPHLRQDAEFRMLDDDRPA